MLKRQHRVTATFSMASMTDVIFLLLIFFMVTSTFVLPTAMEVNLPESSEHTPIKPGANIFIDSAEAVYVTSQPGDSAVSITMGDLGEFLGHLHEADSTAYVAVYADEAVTYGTLIRVLDMGGTSGLKMVLATKQAPQSVMPPSTTGSTDTPATND